MNFPTSKQKFCSDLGWKLFRLNLLINEKFSVYFPFFCSLFEQALEHAFLNELGLLLAELGLGFASAEWKIDGT